MLQNCNVSGVDGRRTTMCIRFRPNRLGRSFGRKLGGLYDDYVKGRFVSGCAINKKDEEVVLHTQEVTGSSPVAPTIKINNLRSILVTSYAPRRRSEDQRPVEARHRTIRYLRALVILEICRPNDASQFGIATSDVEVHGSLPAG